MRAIVANRYSEGLSDFCHIPNLISGNTSAWAQYTLKIDRRDKVQKDLKSCGIPSVIYYPIPLSKQIGYKSFPSCSMECRCVREYSRASIKSTYVSIS